MKLWESLTLTRIMHHKPPTNTPSLFFSDLSLCIFSPLDIIFCRLWNNWTSILFKGSFLLIQKVESNQEVQLLDQRVFLGLEKQESFISWLSAKILSFMQLVLEGRDLPYLLCEDQSVPFHFCSLDVKKNVGLIYLMETFLISPVCSGVDVPLFSSVTTWPS